MQKLLLSATFQFYLFTSKQALIYSNELLIIMKIMQVIKKE